MNHVEAQLRDADIVSDLAKGWPWITSAEIDYDSWRAACPFCYVISEEVVEFEEELADPDFHDPTCLGRRAKEARA